MEVELEYYKKENYRLIHENASLKKEKSFLIDQIKFMQSIIKSNNNSNCNTDIEKNVSNGPKLVMANKKPFGRLFSVFLICMISVLFVSFDIGGDGGKIEFGSSTMSLNDVNKASTSLPGYVYKIIILLVLFSGYGIYKQFSKKERNEKFAKLL
jgi:hypothetical protein